METRFAFGASLDLDLLGIEVDDKTLIPGLAVASSRAKPLAGNSYSIVNISYVINLCSQGMAPNMILWMHYRIEVKIVFLLVTSITYISVID